MTYRGFGVEDLVPVVIEKAVKVIGVLGQVKERDTLSLKDIPPGGLPRISWGMLTLRYAT